MHKLALLIIIVANSYSLLIDSTRVLGRKSFRAIKAVLSTCLFRQTRANAECFVIHVIFSSTNSGKTFVISLQQRHSVTVVIRMQLLHRHHEISLILFSLALLSSKPFSLAATSRSFRSLLFTFIWRRGSNCYGSIVELDLLDSIM